MISNRKKVSPLSSKDIERHAKNARWNLIFNHPIGHPVLLEDVLDKIESGFGFRLDVRDDKYFSQEEAWTDFAERELVISESTYGCLDRHNCPKCYRHRFTVAHELGHIILHDGQMPRTHSAAKGVRLYRQSELRAYEDAEWQANDFGGAFLASKEDIGQFKSADHLSLTMGVSIEVARIRWKRFNA